MQDELCTSIVDMVSLHHNQLYKMCSNVPTDSLASRFLLLLLTIQGIVSKT